MYMHLQIMGLIFCRGKKENTELIRLENIQGVLPYPLPIINF